MALTKKQTFLAFTLTLLTFVMGTSEFVIVGLLTEVAADLNVTVASAGTLVSGFAIAYAIGTPLLTGWVSRFPKYPLMLTLIIVFILGNIISALTSSFGVLLAARIVTAAASGVLTALAMTVASDTMPAARRSSVIALIFAGFTISNVLGVPLGTFIGQLGSWHLTFWTTALLGVIAFIISLFILPKTAAGEKSSIVKQLVLFKNPKILVGFFIPTFSIAGTYTIYTYITPIIEDELGIASSSVGLVLLAYGLFSIGSNFLAGKIAGRNGIGDLRYAFIIQAVIIGSLYVTMDITIAGLISIMLMAVMIYVMNATIQIYLMDQAAAYSTAARDFASSLTPVSVNIGITLGSALGGVIVAYGNLPNLAIVGGICALIASLLSFISYRMEN
ncbi:MULTISPECIES: MFS transporter [Terribacillus]|uniref:MFS transporter n=1 Tax=Terribacillus saccharophilus TaxID=361277 RepID=A0ABX4GUG6_9BACI|nr:MULTISPECIES: MFS transporter [Terribacillus]PAD34036.1 MFS transporter [Terribacillus saccharophilus]PAD94719.1 MFS transporter [Terribacillus saccharophilus]PAD98509.1 MFS transporter [Terribacillus saccharophilus]